MAQECMERLFKVLVLTLLSMPLLHRHGQNRQQLGAPVVFDHAAEFAAIHTHNCLYLLITTIYRCAMPDNTRYLLRMP